MDTKLKNTERKRWTIGSIIVGTVTGTLMVYMGIILSKLYKIYYNYEVVGTTVKKASSAIDNMWIWLIIDVAVFIAAWVIGTIKCGEKDEDGKVKVVTLNYIPVEVFLILFALGFGLAFVPLGTSTGPYGELSSMLAFKIAGIKLSAGEAGYMPGTRPVEFLVLAMTAGSVLLSVLSYIATVLKIKSRTFLGTTIVGIIYRHVTGSSKEKNEFSKTLLYKLIAVICLFTVVESVLYFFLGTIGVIIGVAVAIVAAVKLDDKVSLLRAGLRELRKGNLDYKVEIDEKDAFSDIADDINHISEAVKAAIDKELTNERLKTELISNVSHDIKTPLTSMITYIDLLKREGLDSEHAPEYLEVIDSKTMRLKKLIDDLFEAAKVSSGAIPVTLTELDLASMTEQTLAELGDKLENAGLEVIYSCHSDDTMVMADGKQLFRVMENLLVNVSKYALSGSRVYIDIEDGENQSLLLKIKNISREVLNISPEELMERFTRGERARNTEGSGLGLAIAKDLTQLQGGNFDITIEGDLFMVTVELKRKNVYN